MNLVIVESPSKAKTINKYLGKDYLVKASKGHVVDLPKSKLGIDVENNFVPDYQITNSKSLSEIKKAFKNADNLILAVDLDREGEAIGWHIARELKVIDEKGKPKGKKSVKRIVFSEITKDAIKEAIANPREIDMNLVNAQQARRVLDRLVGYKLSPLLWKKIKYGLSAGRVQSVALRLVVEREEERLKFISAEYWTIDSTLLDKKPDQIKSIIKLSKEESEEKKSTKGTTFELSKIDGKKPEIKTETDAKAILKDLSDKKITIEKIKEETSSKNPRPPFITSTLQQAGVNFLGYSAKKVMMVAQKLYEAGYITYMRTDSLNMSNTAIEAGKKYLEKTFGKDYVQSEQRAYKNKNKNAQEAHECIRPVDFFSTAENLNLEGEEKKVYDLIWKRALATLMPAAVIKGIAVTANSGKYEFKTNGSKVVFDGYLKVYPEKIGDKLLPTYKEGQELFIETITAGQHFTEPPARYSEATLIKKLEELEIGRPSTYASIISTIIARKYVDNINRYLKPTDVGTVVNKLLTKYFMNVVDYDFTRIMEEKLDSIAEGEMDWKKMLAEFYGPFDKSVAKRDKEIPRSEFTELGKSDEKCPECGKPMVIKLGKFGKFLSCSTFPKCKGMKTIINPEDINNNGVPDLLDKEIYESAPKAIDGREYVLKQGRYGNFWAHPDYPEVKDAKPLVLTKQGMVAKYGEIPKTKDGRDFLVKKGKYGEFWAHPDYPEVKEIIRIKKKKND